VQINPMATLLPQIKYHSTESQKCTQDKIITQIGNKNRRTGTSNLWTATLRWKRRGDETEDDSEE
jgi:hypothetical protein